MPGAGADSPKVQNLLTGNRHSFYLTQAVEAERQKPGVITGLWPTPATRDHHAQGANLNTRARSASLATVVQKRPDLWPTPVVGDATGGRTSKGKDRPDEGGLRLEAMKRDKWPTPTRADGLRGPDYAKLHRDGSGGFPTPRSEDSECAGAHRGVPDTLTSHARLFPTPTVQDAENCGGPSQANRNSLSLKAEAGGGLNPAWVEWLMGWPPEWTNPRCSLLATEPDTWAQEPAGLPRLAPKSMAASERRGRLSILGNGWVPQVACVVLARIVGALEEDQ